MKHLPPSNESPNLLNVESISQFHKLIREYYRTDIWTEHSALGDKYPGYRLLIDWGREFIEGNVLPDLALRNRTAVSEKRSTSAYFWVHRDAPRPVLEALRILAYTGIVSEIGTGLKTTRGEIGTRYMVNLGCLFAEESIPTVTALAIARGLAVKRMKEFGANHEIYKTIKDIKIDESAPDALGARSRALAQSVDILDLTEWQLTKIKELKLRTLGDVLEARESTLQQAYYVGEIRSRRMKNAAVAAVFEYLSG